jgi:adenylate kinase
VAAGQLVSDDEVWEIVQKRIHEHDWNYGFILDGYPRNAAQAMYFLEHYDIDAVILIDVPDDVVRERVLSRRLCGKCGLDYNLIYHRPKQDDVCDVCGSGLQRRADDTEEALADRLRTFHESTKPILELFRRKELVVVVDGTQNADGVYAQIREKLGLASERRAGR